MKTFRRGTAALAAVGVFALGACSTFPRPKDVEAVAGTTMLGAAVDLATGGDGKVGAAVGAAAFGVGVLALIPRCAPSCQIEREPGSDDNVGEEPPTRDK